MSKRYGITIKNKNKVTFDSTKPNLLVDLNANPKHYDIVRVLGTAIFAPALGTTTEELFKIEHKLGYVPMVWAYFWQDSDVVGDGISSYGQYYRNFYPYEDVGGDGSDILYYSIDDRYFKLFHTLKPLIDFTSTANTKPIKCKYYIISQPRLYSYNTDPSNPSIFDPPIF